MSFKDELQEKLAKLRATSVVLSPEDAEEAKLRAEVETEEKRLEGEKTKKRELEKARVLDAARKKVGPDVICELVDLDHAGVYVIRNPPGMSGEDFQEKIRTNGNATALDTANLVIASMVYPDPEKDGIAIRERFDTYQFAAQSLSNVALRLGGLKIEMRAKK